MSEVKTNYSNNEDYNKPFPTMLRKLIDEKNIATQSEVAEYAKVTRQSISSYQNGTSVPSITVFEKIVEFFNVKKGLKYSTDYWLGLTKEPYKDLESKGIYDKLGLTEESQRNLETINQIEKIYEYQNKTKLAQNAPSLIDTINLLLSELGESTRRASVLDYIDKYINLHISKDYAIEIKEDGEINVVNKKDAKRKNRVMYMPAEYQIETLLLKMEQKLINMRNQKQEQSSIESKNNKSKKKKN